jgi:hypothetical protein
MPEVMARICAEEETETITVAAGKSQLAGSTSPETESAVPPLQPDLLCMKRRTKLTYFTCLHIV